jgi:uncharacterized protein (DUF362 family)
LDTGISRIISEPKRSLIKPFALPEPPENSACFTTFSIVRQALIRTAAILLHNRSPMKVDYLKQNLNLCKNESERKA